MTLKILPVLKQLHGELKRSRWVSLVGMDGLVIAAVPAEGDTEDKRELLVTEYSALIRSIRSMNREFSLGVPLQLQVGCEEEIIILELVDEDCFLLSLLDANGSTGFARYLLHKAAHRLRGLME